MKEKDYTSFCKLLLLIGVIIFPLFALAQDQPDPGPCPDCPIDGGLGLLLAAGVGYGVKKYRETKKLHKQDV